MIDRYAVHARDVVRISNTRAHPPTNNQIVTGHKELQQYAAETCFNALAAARVHETAVAVGGYVLGTYGGGGR